MELNNTPVPHLSPQHSASEPVLSATYHYPFKRQLCQGKIGTLFSLLYMLSFFQHFLLALAVNLHDDTGLHNQEKCEHNAEQAA